MEDEMKLEFEKLSLQKEDVLIIKVSSEGLSANDVIEKMSTVRNDEFVKFVQDRGNPVLVIHDGISFEILRMCDNDKVFAYLDVSTMTDEESVVYEDLIKFKLQDSIGDKLICMPVKSKTSMKVKKGEHNGD
jgi:hypothetical protein